MLETAQSAGRPGDQLVQIQLQTPDSESAITDVHLDGLRDELVQGLMYTHSRANANTSKMLEVAAFSYALMELLIERGIISVEELDERKRKLGEVLLEKFNSKGMGVVVLKDEADKYTYQGGVIIDCENRRHLCRSACCRLRFALSVQDLEEGKLRWDLGHPYMIRHSEDGYCHHLKRENGHCGIYENRPLTCRSYDCRNDTRIWEDFEKRIPSPKLRELLPDEEAVSQKVPVTI